MEILTPIGDRRILNRHKLHKTTLGYLDARNLENCHDITAQFQMVARLIIVAIRRQIAYFPRLIFESGSKDNLKDLTPINLKDESSHSHEKSVSECPFS